jgi:hypothetical protein
MLVPGKLPGNEFALKNAIFVSPSDYQKYSKSSRKCFVQIKQFIFELLPTDQMPDGQFGASALQKDMLRISKIDTSPLQITKARDLVQNPISQIDFILELIKADASTLVGSIVELNVDELGEAMRQVYDGKIINLQE